MSGAPDPFKGKLHVFVGDGRTACGKIASKVNTLPPRSAQHATCVTCKRALAS